jgi:ABC-type sugar transport system permease subunit
LFLLPWIVGLLVFTVGPMIYSFLLSFAESDIIQPPKWRGLGNYVDAFDVGRSDTFLISLRVTFTYAVISIPLGIASALALALLLNQKVKGVALWRALYYIPSLASGVAISLIWMKVFNPETGLLNGIIYGPDGHRNLFGLGGLLSNLAGTPDKPINWLGNPHTVLPAFIIMGLWGAGGGTIIFLAGLQGIPQTYYEAATLDGAGVWRRFRNVTFPLLTPTIFFSFITGVIGALQAFTQAFVMTDGGPDRATMFYVLNLYKEAFGHLHMGYASALAWMLFVVILAVTAIQLWFAKRWVFYEGGFK